MSISNSRPFSVRPPVSSSTIGGKGRRRPRQKFRPDLLALEARALLSTLTVTNDNDSGTGSLRAELGAANAGDTINFAPSAYGTIKLTSGPLQVATSVDIKGPGAKEVTVSGDDQSTVFEVQGGVTATISGLTVTDGLSDLPTSNGGGGIANYGNLTLSGDTITGNSAPGHVGPSGGLVGNGGGVLAGGPVTITGSTVSGNSAFVGGGVASLGAPVTITGSTISNNESAFGRGGIDSTGSVSLTGCTVSGNTGGGIGIYGTPYFPGPIPTLTVTGSTISGNSAAYYGGGILAATANVTVSGSVIADNTAESPGGFTALGGGIAMQGSFYAPTSEVNALTITGSTFVGNQAGGGAIYTGPYASLSATGSSFVGNTANGPGSAAGGAMDLVASLQGTITNSQFTGNQAVGSSSGGDAAGGAIEFNSQGGYVPGTLTIQNSTFAHNTAQGGTGGGSGSGGAIDIEADTLKVTGGSIVGNSAIGGSGGGQGEGGGVANSGTASFTGVLISLNAADGGSGGGSGYGGGLYIATGAITTLKNTQVVGNSASTAGNNIYGS